MRSPKLPGSIGPERVPDRLPPSTPPTACNADPCTTTSLTPSPPTTTATRLLPAWHPRPTDVLLNLAVPDRPAGGIEGQKVPECSRDDARSTAGSAAAEVICRRVRRDCSMPVRARHLAAASQCASAVAGSDHRLSGRRVRRWRGTDPQLDRRALARGGCLRLPAGPKAARPIASRSV